jgi:thiol-disulfide isomerase/thioredoxin
MTGLPVINTARRAAWTAVTLFVTAGWSLASSQQPPGNFVSRNIGKPVGAVQFVDAALQARTLADFKGKIVLLNVWATWCIPCRKEMPVLDRLQAKLGGPDFDVVPLSIDRGGTPVVRKFYDEVGIGALPIYVDVSGQAVATLRVTGFPTSLLIDRTGLELGLVIGPAEWDSPEIADFIGSVVTNPGAALATRADQGGQPELQHDATEAQGALARSLRWLRGLLTR